MGRVTTASFAIIFFAFPLLLLADGGFKAHRDYPADPTIPMQRALISFRDGAQTLVVESTFQTQSLDVAWILPVPAEPTKLEQADSGLLETLDIQLQPQVIEESRGARFVIAAAALLAIPLVLARLILRTPLPLYALALFAAVFWFIFLPPFGMTGRSLAGGGDASAPRLDILDSRRIGNYDVQVIRSHSADAVADFLTQNSFQALSADERKIFDDYIHEGWCFVVARLRQDGAAGPATPHPIAVTFPAKSPIFPMRATKMAGSKTHVELFVIADSQARADGFETICADHLFQGNLANWRLPDTYFQLTSPLEPVSHPDLKGRMWSGCIVTKLTADLSPSQMNRDISLAMVPFAGRIQQVLDTPLMRRESVEAFLCSAGAALVVFLCMARPLKSWEERVRRLRYLGAALAGIIIVAGLFYLSFPVVEVREGLSPRGARQKLYAISMAAKQAMADGKLDKSLLNDPAKLPSILRPYLGPAGLVNDFTGQPIAMRRSPGNYTVSEEDGKAYLDLYDYAIDQDRIPLAGISNPSE